MLRNILYTVGTILCLLLLAGVLLRTPDTNAGQMEDKYGLGSIDRICYGLDGNCVRIRDEGNSQGPALVLLHGSNDSLLTWRGIVDQLKKDFRILTVDLPGHGLSGPHVADDYSASAMIEMVTAIANHAELDTFYLAGNSMGGWISWRYALAHGNRLDGLILINGSGAPLPAGSPPAKIYLGARLMQNSLIRPLLKYFTPRSVVKKSLEGSVFDPSIIDKGKVDQYWELLRYPGNRRATAIRATTDRELTLASQLGRISIPTLIIWGKEDKVIPVGAAKTFNTRIPDSRIIIYENVGHLPQLEVPEKLADDIRIFVVKTRP